MVYQHKIGKISKLKKRLGIFVAVSILIAQPLYSSVISTHSAFATESPVCTYDSAELKRWKVSWGRQFNERNSAPLFNKQSHGGLVSLNDEPVPAYMANPAQWHWLYVVEGVETQFKYSFADGTVRSSQVTFSEVDGCQTPTITWGHQTPTLPESASNFIGSPRYVRANSYGPNAGNQDLASQVRVPVAATDVRFTVAGELVTDTNDANETKDNDIFKTSGAPTGSQWWRLQKALPAGIHTVTGEFLLDGNWHPITGSSTVYSIDTPTASYASPNDSRYVFRASDNPIRLRVEDQFEQFRRMVVTVNGVQHEVVRESCDLRQAGNYLFCDVSTSPTWSPLPAGQYTARTTTYTKVNNRVDNLVSREFTIDTASPSVSNFTAPQLVANSATVSASVIDDNGVDRVRFFIANTNEHGECKNHLSGILEVFGFAGDNDTYTAQINTSSLNGRYCVLVSARDIASHTSTPQFRTIEIDNQAPTVAITNPANNGSALRQSLEIRGTVQDDNLRHYWLHIKRNGTEIHNSTVHTESSFVNQPLHTVTEEGYYEVTLAARDLVGGGSNTGNRSEDVVRTFTIDTSLPTISIDDLEVSGNTLNVSVSGTDSLSGLRALGINIYNESNSGSPLINNLGRIKDNIAPQTLTDNVSRSIDISSLSPGTYTLRAVSIDHAGNYSEQSLQTFSISGENEENGGETDSKNGVSDESSRNPITQGAQNQDINTAESDDNNLFTSITGFDMGDGIIGAITSPVGDTGDVLGAEDDGFGSTFGDGNILGQTAAAQDVSNSPLKAFGVLWYWWLVAFAVFASAWWLIAAQRRKQNDDVRI